MQAYVKKIRDLRENEKEKLLERAHKLITPFI